ncbi:MAG: type II toxin-antitoxin system RelE/ParE family toxin [Bacillota bacterium]
MRKFKISIIEAAEQDLTEIIEYIASDNPAAAFKLTDKIDESIIKLEGFPQIGVIPKNRRLERRGYRMLIIDNYLVFYVIMDDETVEIRRIISGKRDYKFLL